MIKNNSFTSFCNFLTKRMGKSIVYILNPTAGNLSPLLDYSFLLRSKLALSLELAESLFNI